MIEEFGHREAVVKWRSSKELRTRRPCPFCGSESSEVRSDAVEYRDGKPLSSQVFCLDCQASGPAYLAPLVCKKGEPWPDVDPRVLAIAAWNGDVTQEFIFVC